ncbi:MAG: hypothetical protein Q9191_007785, partial [Dirinaria sp. TL-2023a]
SRVVRAESRNPPFADPPVKDRTNCLGRDSLTVQSHNGLRRNRKALLSNLSSLVKDAKTIRVAITEKSIDQIQDVILDELIMKAFRTVLRAVKFLDLWIDDVLLTQSTDNRVHNNNNNTHHLEPASPTNCQNGRAQTQAQSEPPARHSAIGTASECLQERPGSASAVIVTRQEQPANSHNETTSDTQDQAILRPPYSRSSHTYVRHSLCNSTPGLRRPSAQPNRQSVSHRISCNFGTSTVPDTELASVKLGAAHDRFLGFLGSFIGLQLESRSSTELLSTTKQAVISCRDMLKIIEAIWERDAQRAASLAEAREEMYCSITDLADAARHAFRAPSPGELDDVYMLDAQKPMVDAATACVRAAGECVAESRFVLERLGDFDFEPLYIDLAPPGTSEDARLDASKASTMIDPERGPTSGEASESCVPLQPTSEPPPPPSDPSKSRVPLVLKIPTTALLTSQMGQTMTENSTLTTDLVAQPLLPPLPPFAGLLSPSDEPPPSPQLSSGSSGEVQRDHEGRLRTNSFDVSSAGASSTFIGSMRNSDLSESSTRATSPDASYVSQLTVSPRCDSLAQSRSTFNDDFEEAEKVVQQKTFAHEIIFNKDGQISGGTLPALIERLTTHDSTPDASYVSTFYLTFRLFATPLEFSQALIDRFTYIGDCPSIAGPVRLRVYNVFKGWLESHWRHDADTPALDLILSFARRQLQPHLPTAGKRLTYLAEKVNAVEGPLVPRLVSSMGKTNTSIAAYVAPDSPLPSPAITKSQLTALRNWKLGGASVSILDFDPLELARQFTIKESRIFCSILPEELLATEWTKKNASIAVNVRAMSTLSTDLANLVADCILQLDDPKKRATIIKQWIKIAKKCLELANYDSLMAIICSLNSSTILRLKRTWELVSSRTKATLEELKAVVDCSRNYAILRQRLQTTAPPCLPFVGTYLTDLTFVDVGNQPTRQLQGEGGDGCLSVINFDKHVKTAKIISELQRFQIPYRFTEVPELQTWMQDQLVRVRSDSSNVQSYYRRSLLLEPREQPKSKSEIADNQALNVSKERLESFWWPPYHKPSSQPPLPYTFS